MKKIMTAIMGIFMCLLIAVPAFAATDGMSSGSSVVDRSRKGDIYIDYQDTVEGTDPIEGAEFTFYKVAELDDEGGYISLIEGIETFDEDDDMEAVLAKVKEAYENGDGVRIEYPTVVEGLIYKTVTNAEGKASLQDVELGLYVAEESRPAEEHFASTPFYVAVPYTENNVWKYSVTAEPKALPGGDLVISKTVSGAKAEQDREWHFTVTLTDANGNEYTEPVSYVKSDGTEGTITSGGVITLKHGESATLKCIPVGTEYSVTEKEADTDGYSTSSTGSTGRIMRKTVSTAAFTNHTDVDTGDSYAAYIEGGILAACLIAMAVLIMKKVKKDGEGADEK